MLVNKWKNTFFFFFVNAFPELLLTVIAGNTYLERHLVLFLLTSSPITAPFWGQRLLWEQSPRRREATPAALPCGRSPLLLCKPLPEPRQPWAPKSTAAWPKPVAGTAEQQGRPPHYWQKHHFISSNTSTTRGSRALLSTTMASCLAGWVGGLGRRALSVQVGHNATPTQRLALPFFSPVNGTKSSLSLCSSACFSKYESRRSLSKGPVADLVVWSFCRNPAGSKAFCEGVWKRRRDGKEMRQFHKVFRIKF